MTKHEALERAGKIWSGLSHGIQMESVGTGCFVRIDGDDRTHRLDHNGHVACQHQDCLDRELDLNARPVVIATELSDTDAIAKAGEVFAWLERAMLVGSSQDTVVRYLSLELQSMFIRGAKAGAADLHSEIKKSWGAART